jgi:hypothetical protein
VTSGTLTGSRGTLEAFLVRASFGRTMMTELRSSFVMSGINSNSKENEELERFEDRLRARRPRALEIADSGFSEPVCQRIRRLNDGCVRRT